MTDFTGSDSFPATIVGPDDGTPATALSVNDMGVLLADRTIWLKRHFTDLFTLINVSFAASGPFASVIDLKTIDAFTDLPGIVASSANAVLVNDLLSVEVMMHADYLGSNRMEFTCSSKVGGVSQAGGIFIPRTHAVGLSGIILTRDVLVSDAGASLTIQARGRCTAASGNTTATVYAPWQIAMRHYRKNVA